VQELPSPSDSSVAKAMLHGQPSCQGECYPSFIHGNHVYCQERTPAVGEVLALKKQPGNSHDKFAVTVIKNDVLQYRIGIHTDLLGVTSSPCVDKL
jgi:hypothetical protein